MKKLVVLMVLLVKLLIKLGFSKSKVSKELILMLLGVICKLVEVLSLLLVLPLLFQDLSPDLNNNITLEPLVWMLHKTSIKKLLLLNLPHQIMVVSLLF